MEMCNKVSSMNRRIIRTDDVTTCSFWNYPNVTIYRRSGTNHYYYVRTESPDAWVHKLNVFMRINDLTENQIIKVITHYVAEYNNGDESSELETTVRSNKNNVNEFLIDFYINCLEEFYKSNIRIELIDNDVSHWNVTYCDTKLVEKVIVAIKFNMERFPNQIFSIEKIVPSNYEILKNKIMETQIFLENDCRNVYDFKKMIIELENIIVQFNTHRKIIEYTGKFKEFVNELCGSLSIIDNIEQYENVFSNCIIKKYPSQNQIVSNNTIKHDNRTGIGYGNKLSVANKAETKWDSSNMATRTTKQNASISIIIANILGIIGECSDNDFEYLTNSNFVKCVIMILGNVSCIEFEQSIMIFMCVYAILSKIPDKYIGIMSLVQFNHATLLDIAKLTLNNKTLDEHFKKQVQQMIERIEKNKTLTKVVEVIRTPAELYVSEMTKYKLVEDETIWNPYYYINELTKSAMSKKGIERIMNECVSLNVDLPIQYDASIFLMMCSSNLNAFRTVITGPKDTPYENGCFIFDILLPSDYPDSHPFVQFVNHNTKRFNPNLYNDGKVCLSLIGTWGSPDRGSEFWNPKMSTIFQLLLSIQSQILVEEPWFNEPGRYTSTDVASKKASVEYNKTIEGYTFMHAIIDLIIHAEKIYGTTVSNIIKTHFKHKKSDILRKYGNMSLPENRAYFDSHKHILETL